ncbi:MAG: uroporphyrinogen decarboxylase family protein [Candidatus Cloacimonadales bacterium]|nr:uroporphyrinogen decarboxylase family protein [Candidatus Cloacimonadota bacterium]MDX9977180.1 uroporphyrinogen decarboxylase family protein [Candidatus Cloacimonadales bacterium]
MSSMQRVLTTMNHQEPDKVPLFLFTTMHPAKEKNISIKEYFASAESVAEGQLLMRTKYRNDCYYTFYYASIELEAFGVKSFFRDGTPVNAGTPFINTPEDIIKMRVPQLHDSPSLQKVLKTTEILKKEGGDVPIIGVVISPFSLPIMQMGFAKYIDLLYESPNMFDILIQKNIEFCLQWFQAQLDAGATAICYFDPVSSPSIVPPAIYKKYGFPITQQIFKKMQAPIAIHLASGRSLRIAEDLKKTDALVIGCSSEEDIGELKDTYRGKMTVLGNLNGIEMCNWGKDDAYNNIQTIIKKAAKGGGLIISDNHGEIPYQVKHETLMHISDAVEKYGYYPIRGV